MKGGTQCYFLLIFLFIVNSQAIAQSFDSVYLKKSQILVLEDSVFVPDSDTVVLAAQGQQYTIKPNPYYKSDKFYEDLQSKASQSKITSEIYKLLFSSPVSDVYEGDQVVKSEDVFEQYTNKNITAINIVHVPIIIGNILDTSYHVNSKYKKLLDAIHTDTWTSIIRKNLIFDVGDKVNPFVLSDSERIIRSFRYIEDARIQVLNDLVDTTAVTVTVVVKDRFAWEPDGKYRSVDNFEVGIRNYNILGSTNQVGLDYLYNAGGEPRNGYNFDFVSRNIGRSFAYLRFELANNWKEEKIIGSISKEFVSPEIRTGGEIRIGSIEREEGQVFLDSVYSPRIKRHFRDVWIGRSLLLAGKNNRSSLYIGARYLNNQFDERPEVDEGVNERYHNRHIFLVSTAFQKINYLKTRYILSYGITEDLPVGFLVDLSIGRDFTEFGNRNYLGVRSGFANYYEKIGYFMLGGEAGSFYQRNSTSNLVWRTFIRYFTPLIPVGRARFRNFLNFELTKSSDLTRPETVNLRSFISDLNTNLSYGTQYYAANFETDWFMPWYLYGFRFVPFASVTYGNVWEDREEPDFEGNVLGVGCGVNIRNESLSFKTLSLKFNYFPTTLPEASKMTFEVSFSIPRFFGSIRLFKPSIVILD